MIEPVYSAAPYRYEGKMKYRRCGKSGILLPEISLGLWHNFGDVDTLSNSRKKLHYAFDNGITHIDLANNYRPSYGSAEETFGHIMKTSSAPYRDELFISTKAGHDMWPGPYGEWGSRKTDVGKALYVGISKYPADKAGLAYGYLKSEKVPCLLYQGRYNIINREPEEDHLPGAC